MAQLQISPSDCYVNFQNQLTALLYFKSVNCNSYNVLHEFMKMSEMQDILALNLLRWNDVGIFELRIFCPKIAIFSEF